DTSPRLHGSRLSLPFALACLTLPLLLYLVPILAGYAWNNYGPGTPNLPGLSGYQGRMPSTPSMADWFSIGVIVLPFHARLHDDLVNAQLPLWNPYQGLGQPFAAQGEGSPYFPIAALRALLPFALANTVTVAHVFLSGLFQYLLLRRLGLSMPSALAGAAAWV